MVWGQPQTASIKDRHHGKQIDTEHRNGAGNRNHGNDTGKTNPKSH